MAAVHDGTALTVWTDGVAGVPVPAAGAIAQSGAPMAIGGAAGGLPAGFFDGVIDEVRLDQRVWSAERIAAHVANLSDPAFVAEGTPEAGNWLDQGTWGARKPLTIDAAAVAGPLGPTAVFVSVDDVDLAAGARSDGLDIVFTDDDGVTRLAHVVESYDSGTGSLRAWVRVPDLPTGADRSLFVYYANPTGARSAGSGRRVRTRRRPGPAAPLTDPEPESFCPSVSPQPGASATDEERRTS